MSDVDLRCNVMSCRKLLTGKIWVTICSHAFCEEHAQSLLSGKSNKCPGCSSDLRLNQRYDIVCTNADPEEKFKSMALAGMRPDVVLEICGRAIGFWMYQMAQERDYQAQEKKHAESSLETAIANYESKLLTLRQELTATRRRFEEHQKDVSEYSQKMQDLREQLSEKTRQLRVVQGKLNYLRLKVEEKSVGNTIAPHSGVLYEPKLYDNDHLHSAESFDLLSQLTREKRTKEKKIARRDKEDFIFQPNTSSQPRRQL